MQPYVTHMHHNVFSMQYLLVFRGSMLTALGHMRRAVSVIICICIRLHVAHVLHACGSRARHANPHVDLGALVNPLAYTNPIFQSESGEIFDKGQGIRLLVEHMKCDISNGTILVCGDSSTDLPMLQACLEANPSGVYTVWVTRSDELKQTVRFIGKDSIHEMNKI